MLKNKALLLLSILLAMVLVLGACGNNEEATNPMSFIGIEELKNDIVNDTGEYIMLDTRIVDSYEEAHIQGSYMADVDAANKGGDDPAGIASLEAALSEATGSKTGNDGDKYALLCNSGASYAQKATDLLIEMGISPDQIYTVEGGMKAWNDGGDDYTDLLE